MRKIHMIDAKSLIALKQSPCPFNRRMQSGKRQTLAEAVEQPGPFPGRLHEILLDRDALDDYR